MDDLLRYMDTDRDDMISYPEFCAAFRWMVGLGAGEVLPERVEGMGTTLGRRLSSVGSSTTQQQIQQMAQLRAKQARMEEIPERSRGEVQYGEEDDGTVCWSSRVGPGRGAAGPQTRYATTEASSRYGVTSSHEQQPSSQVAWAEGGSAYADARDGRGGSGGNDANRLQQVYSPERDALSRSLLASASSFGSGAVGGSGERADEFAGGEAYNTGGGGGIGGMGDQQQRKPNVHVNRHGSIDVSLSRDQVARLGLSGSLQGGYQQHHQQHHQQSSTSSSTTTSGDMMRAALSPLPDARSHGGGRSALAGTSSSSASFHATSTSMAMNSTTAARSPPRAIAASGLQMAHRFTRVQVPPFKEASVAQVGVFFSLSLSPYQRIYQHAPHTHTTPTLYAMQMVASYVTELQEQVRSSGSGLRVMYQKWSQEGFVSMSPTKRADESDGSTRWFSLLVVVAASGENVSSRTGRGVGRERRGGQRGTRFFPFLTDTLSLRAALSQHCARSFVPPLLLHIQQKSALKDTAWQDDLAQRFGAIGIAAPAFLQLEPGARR